MVNRSQRGRFWREDTGASLIEGLIVFPLILLVLAAFFEFGFAVHH